MANNNQNALNAPRQAQMGNTGNLSRGSQANVAPSPRAWPSSPAMPARWPACIVRRLPLPR